MNATVNDPVVLGCWKEIAQYLGKGVRTAQRWEQEFGLPVRRPDGATHKSAVVASSRDIDVWLHQRWSKRRAAERVREESDVESLRILIARNRKLRRSHEELVQDLSITLKTLMESCNRISVQNDP